MEYIMDHIKEICECISVFIGLIGLFMAVNEYRKSNKVKRATYIDQLTERLKSDQDIRDMIYDFQYGKFKYTKDFHGSELEKKVDRALQYFSYICYLKEKRIITSDEFMFFEIDISQALRCKDLREYLYNLYHYECKIGNYDPQGNGIENYSFGSLIRYGKQKRIIQEDFFIKEKGHKHFLNFDL